MRPGLTLQQKNLLNANVKQATWLFEVDQNNNGNIDYFWSTQAYTFDGQAYTFKIISFSPITLNMGSPESSIIPPCHITVQLSFKDNEVDGLYASDFEGASFTIRLIVKADLRIPAEPGDEDEASAPADFQEAEIMTWRFKVLSSSTVDQIMTWECQDWFTPYLEGDYPNTPLVSDLFRADIMKNDNVRVPFACGEPFFPVRWIIKNTDATYVDSDTFTVSGDQTALFSTGQYLTASCGGDGDKACWVDSSSYGAGITTVDLTASSNALTSNLTSVQTDHYLLGESGITYSIDRARTPTQANGKSTYLPASYTFKQDTITGSDGESYKVVQLICNDANKDGTNDSNGFWGVIGNEIYDLPIKFSRSDTETLVGPADIVSYILQDWGISSDEIDSDIIDAASAIFTSRGLEFNIGLWFSQDREKLISKLFSLAGMIPIYRDKIGVKVLSKVSSFVIEEDLVEPGSFKINKALFTQKQKDSGYVTWQVPTEPVDQVNKSLVAAKSSTSNKSDVTIEAEWILDSEKAQKAGKLALQRILLKDKTVTFEAQGKILLLEPGDTISINPANFGAEGAAYDCLITKMIVHEGLLVEVECSGFSAALDDWDDLSASEITVSDANTSKAYTPVCQGQVDVNDTNDEASNKITQTVLIASDGVLATNDDPATNGGFIATNEAIRCYNTSGYLRFEAIYSGDDQGDVTIGDYGNGQGIKWDQSATLLSIKVTESGGIQVAGGGDITLTGSDTDPGIIKFNGTSYSVQMGGDASGERFLIKASETGDVDCFIGEGSPWFGPDGRFKNIELNANLKVQAEAGDFGTYDDGCRLSVETVGPDIMLYVKDGATSETYKFWATYLGIGSHKSTNFGEASKAWAEAYADNWNNVADFFFLDLRKEGENIIQIDDIEVIKAIKSSGVFDSRTGLALIDDNTLPEWLLTKDKKTGEIERDPDGKPYLSLKTMISLLMGGIRQLDARIKK